MNEYPKMVDRFINPLWLEHLPAEELFQWLDNFLKGRDLDIVGRGNGDSLDFYFKDIMDISSAYLKHELSLCLDKIVKNFVDECENGRDIKDPDYYAGDVLGCAMEYCTEDAGIDLLRFLDTKNCRDQEKGFDIRLLTLKAIANCCPVMETEFWVKEVEKSNGEYAPLALGAITRKRGYISGTLKDNIKQITEKIPMPVIESIINELLITCWAAERYNGYTWLREYLEDLLNINLGEFGDI